MPNHVINHLEFRCSEERLKEILTAICYEETNPDAEMTGPGTIDFNRITPMPESLNIESGSRTIDGVSLYLTSLNPDVHHFGEDKLEPEAFRALLAQVGKRYGFVEYNPAMSREEIEKRAQYTDAETLLELGKTAVENQRQYGAISWYEWRTRPDTWNTKWNSYYPYEYQGGDTITFQTAWSAPHPIAEKLSRMYPEVEIQHRWANEDFTQSCGSRTYQNGEVIDWDEPQTDRERMELSAELWDSDLEECGYVLNAEGTNYIRFDYPEYPVMNVCGVSVLYSDSGLTDYDVPKGTRVYRLRKDLEGKRFVSMDADVPGTKDCCIVSKKLFNLGPTGVLHFTGDTQPVLTEEKMSFMEYKEGNQEHGEVMDLG